MIERFLSAAADASSDLSDSCDCHQQHALTASALATLAASSLSHSHSDDDTDSSSVGTDATSLLENEEEEEVEEQESDHTSVTLIEDDSFDFDLDGDDEEVIDDADVAGRVHFRWKCTQYHDDPHLRDATTDWYSRTELNNFREQRRVQVHMFNNLQKRNSHGMGAFGSTLKDLFQACCEINIHDDESDDDNDDDECHSDQNRQLDFWQYASPLRTRQVRLLFPLTSSLQQEQQQPSRRGRYLIAYDHRSSKSIDPVELVGLERHLVPLAKHTLNQRQDYLQKVIWQLQQQFRQQHRLRLKSKMNLEEEVRAASQSASSVCVAWAQIMAQAQWDLTQRLLEQEELEQLDENAAIESEDSSSRSLSSENATSSSATASDIEHSDSDER